MRKMKKTFYTWFKCLLVFFFVTFWIAFIGLHYLKEVIPTEEEEDTFICRHRRPDMVYLQEPRLENLSCDVNECLDKKRFSQQVSESEFKSTVRGLDRQLNGLDDAVKWKMVIFVKSVPENFVYRKVIRETWGSVAYVEGARFYTVFVIGKSNEKVQTLLDKEQDAFHDILQIDLTDKYTNVVYKTLAGMQWAVENLSDDYYYSTVDDDMVINLGAAQDHVDNYRGLFSEKVLVEFPIICMHLKRVDWGPIRDVRSKYNVSYKQYKWPYYPDFCLGGMYTTKMGLVKQLWEASRWEQPIPMDDAWITGILREKIGMPWQMLYKVEPPVARHNYVYSVRTEETTRKSMVDDWAKQFDKFKHKTICYCKQDVDSVELKFNRPNLPLSF